MGNLNVCMSDPFLEKAFDDGNMRSAMAVLNADILQKNLTPC